MGALDMMDSGEVQKKTVAAEGGSGSDVKHGASGA
jgi:hypothetical protein